MQVLWTELNTPSQTYSSIVFLYIYSWFNVLKSSVHCSFWHKWKTKGRVLPCDRSSVDIFFCYYASFCLNFKMYRVDNYVYHNWLIYYTNSFFFLPWAHLTSRNAWKLSCLKIPTKLFLNIITTPCFSHGSNIFDSEFLEVD